MARTLTIYQGEDQTPATDITDMVEWPDCEFGQRAYFGESTGSDVRFRDVDGVTGNSQNLPAGLASLSLAAHNVVRWTEGSNTMFRGRVSPKDYSRGAQVAGRAREVRIALDDYNKDLHNIVVHDYPRPAETDKARVQGIMASYLTGNPRVTTNLNGSNFVSSSNTVSLPATTYTRTNVLEVLTSVASAANKQWFVTIDGELFYDGNDSTVYSSPLRISDRDTEVDNNITWAPIWDVGPSSREDGQQLLSGVWLFYGESQYVRVTNPSVANQYSWWEDIIYDDTVTTAAQATVVANAVLARRQYEERTYNVSIGPLLRAQWGSLKHGQLIQIKARAIPDADDAYASRRITELRWTPSSDPESLFAHMTLDRPLRASPYGPGQKADTIIPKPPPVCVSGNPASETLVYDNNDAGWGGTAGSTCCGVSSYKKFGGSGGEHGPFTVTAGTSYRVDVKVFAGTGSCGGNNIHELRVKVHDAGHTLSQITTLWNDYIPYPCTITDIGGTVSIPVGYNHMHVSMTGKLGGWRWTNSQIFSITPGTEVENDPDCVPPGTAGDSPYFARSDDPRFTDDDQHATSRLTADLTNKSGADRVAGDLVIVDTANDASFTTTTTANLATRDFGIVAEAIANNATGSVLLRGFATINLGGATPTRGHYIFSTTTLAQAATSATRAAGAVGQIVEAAADGAVLFWGTPDGTAAVTDHGALTGLADDDHPQYLLATELEAAGHFEVIVSGTAPPVAVTNEAEDNWLYGFVS